MIVPMRKVFVVGRQTDHDRLIDGLGQLGVVHLVPVDADRAVADEHTLAAIDHANRAAQVLSQFTPTGAAPDIAPADAVDETLHLEREAAEGRQRLGVLHRQINELAIWGDLRLEQLDALKQTGLDMTFVAMPIKQLAEIQGELVEPIGEPTGGRQLLAVVSRSGAPELPESAVIPDLPSRDRPALRAEAAEIDAKLKTGADRLVELACLQDAIGTYRQELQSSAAFTVASRGAMTSDALTALQGWVPADDADTIGAGLADQGLDAAVENIEADPEEAPPTLIRYPKWARPIKGLFDIMGTFAGYKEFDVGVPFMLALPIFAAMLIGDGGYGALMLVALLLGYKKIAPKLGREFVQLLIVVGATTLIWGILSGSFFGFLLIKSPLIPVNMTDASRTLVMKISFVIGTIHLSLAQLWQAVRYYPNIRFLSKVGWAIFIWGMFGVVLELVVGLSVLGTDQPFLYLLAAGALLAILFGHPNRNPLKWLGYGIADFPLAAISAFSDVTSYVRLMAVGLASGVLASSFNDMAMEIEFWPLTLVVMILGHGLNLVLCLIALFAHGVRLNMLEFSNNLGMQWTGYAYQPYQQSRRLEQ